MKTTFAYSTLPQLLSERRLTVADMDKRLRKRGFEFDRKTLYRLIKPEPLHRIDVSIIGAICQEFKVGLGDLLVWEPVKPKLRRIDSQTQERLDLLMEKNNEGTINAAERRELLKLGEMVERLSLENARLMASQAKMKSPRKRRESRANTL